jgi:probable F420-dependent oxidoreductase
MTAKLVATLDALSGGRVILGVGAGWLREEFDAVGASWDRRGARMDECIGILRRLWTEPRVGHEGEFYRFAEMGFEPRPAQAPPPILVGGESPPALRRAAQRGDGWLGLRHTPASAADRVRELAALRGSEAPPLEITIEVDAMPTIDAMNAYRDAGVHRLMLNARLLSGGEKSIEAALAGLERLGETMHRHAEPAI